MLAVETALVELIIMIVLIDSIYGCKPLNLKDLKYLVALADTGHFGKAAERTFVSQPTLSAQLKKLEEYLGVKLVERQPKNVQLTDVGKQIVVRARRMLDESEEIIALARSNTDPFAGKLKVGLIPTIGPYLLPRIMPKIRKAVPHLGLMLYEYQTEPLLKRLRDGEIDLGIMALPVLQDGLESRTLYEEAFTVALPTHHPLAAKSTIKVADLKGQTLLLLEDGHCLRDQALEVCSRVDVREPEDFRATSLETLRQMVVAGLGITLLPEMAVESPYGSQRGLVIRQFANPMPSRNVGAVWRKSSTREAAIGAVCDVMASVMAKSNGAPRTAVSAKKGRELTRNT
jgi:LysR family transcriptional regulator, hydrogen peroxide-inducible genes activator